MFPSEQKDNYAYLPDELLEGILLDAPDFTREIQLAFDTLQTQHTAMRNALMLTNRIKRFADLEAVSSPSVAAVDGGLAIEKSIGADTILVAAVGVEGLVREDRRKWTGVQYRHWKRVLSHEGDDAKRFASGVMAALELEIATQAPHDVVIFDGSHLTPIIGLNSMLSLTIESLSPLAAEILEQHQTLRTLANFFTRPSIVSMVKYDSSRELSLSWFEGKFPFDDRTLMTTLLEPGEYSIPVSAAQTKERRQQLQDLHIRIAYPNFPDKDTMNAELERAIQPARRDNIFVTYYRPYDFAPAYRIELKQEAIRSSVRMATILQAVKEQVVSPEIREPYPQYLADEMAKSVSAGLRALNSVVVFDLADTGAERLLRMLVQSYRTD